MIIFPNIEIDTFDIKEDRPNQGEYVFIVLKQEKPPKFTNYNTNGNVPFSLIRICRTKIYKNERIKFFDSTGKWHEVHEPDDIICWGRLKIK